MAHEIVKYHNDMSSVAFRSFTPAQADIFIALCYECKEKGTEKQSIKLSRLKELAGFESKDDKRFISYLDDLSDKLFKLEYRENKVDGGFRKFVLFTSFETDKLNTEDAALVVGVSEDFKYILNNEGGSFLLGYTSFELQQHTQLKSTYSKIMFRQLKKFKRTGWLQLEINEFRRLLDVPESYRMADINRRVLKPIEEELPALFENLNVERIKGGPRGTTVEALKFTFVPQREKAVWSERDIKKTDYICSYCGEPLYLISREDGETFYGHKDGWRENAPCRKTFSNIVEIKGEDQKEKPIEKEKPSSAENIEKKERKKKVIENQSGILGKSGFDCPSCGEPLYRIRNSKGELFYGHKDWESSPCKETFSTVAEIRGFSETPSRLFPNKYEKEENESNEENKRKIDEMIQGMGIFMEKTAEEK